MKFIRDIINEKKQAAMLAAPAADDMSGGFDTIIDTEEDSRD